MSDSVTIAIIASVAVVLVASIIICAWKCGGKSDAQKKVIQDHKKTLELKHQQERAESMRKM